MCMIWFLGNPTVNQFIANFLEKVVLLFFKKNSFGKWHYHFWTSRKPNGKPVFSEFPGKAFIISQKEFFWKMTLSFLNNPPGGGGGRIRDPDPQQGFILKQFFWKITLSCLNNLQVVEVVLQRTGAPFEVMAELWDFFRRPDRLNASFKARSATLGQYHRLKWITSTVPSFC